MIIIHKPIPLTIVKEYTEKGSVMTPDGLRHYDVGDYLVRAPTGCEWPLSRFKVDNYYEEYTIPDKWELR